MDLRSTAKLEKEHVIFLINNMKHYFLGKSLYYTRYTSAENRLKEVVDLVFGLEFDPINTYSVFYEDDDSFMKAYHVGKVMIYPSFNGKYQTLGSHKVEEVFLVFSLGDEGNFGVTSVSKEQAYWLGKGELLIPYFDGDTYNLSEYLM